MTLLRPEYWPLFLLAGALIYLLRNNPEKSNAWHALIDAPLLAFLMPDAKHQKKYKFVWILSLVWCLSIIAIMGPSLKQTLAKEHKKITPRIVLLDLSPNMLTDDILPNRLDRAKFKIKDLLSASSETETALVVFTEEPFLVTPFTEDAKTVNNLLERLAPHLMPIEGQNISKALDYAESLFQKNAMQAGDVLLVTASVPNQSDFDTADRLQNRGYHTSILAIGSPDKLPLSAYESLSHHGGGKFRTISIDNSDIESLKNPTPQATEIEKRSSQYQRSDEGYYLVWVLLILVALAFQAGWYETITDL